MRFLHMADLHLDTSFAARGPVVGARLRRALRDTLTRAVESALHHELDAFLVAGDLFDGSVLTFETQSFLLAQVERLREANIPFLYATGNHDPGGERTAIRWPANTTVFASPTPETVSLRDSSGAVIATITGAGHDSHRVSANLASTFPAWERSATPRIGLLHALVDGAVAGDSHDRYAPCGTADLRAKGYDYWALGHVHERQTCCEDPLATYPGNPQGRSPRESGPRGANLVTILPGEPPQVSFEPLSAVRWETVRARGLELAKELTDIYAVVDELILRSLADRDEPRPSEALMLRLILRGGSPLYRALREPENLEVLRRELLTRLRAKAKSVGIDEVIDLELDARLHRPVDLEAARARSDVLGEALRLVNALRAGSAVLPGLDSADAFAAKPDGQGVQEYVRQLLADADERLVERLLVSDS